MDNWKRVFLPSHIELSDDEKKGLTEHIETSLRQILGSEPEDIMIEYLQVMVLNSKNFEEIAESMSELLDEPDAQRICEIVAKKVQELINNQEKQDQEEPAEKAESTAPSGSFTTKELRERRKRKHEEAHIVATTKDSDQKESKGQHEDSDTSLKIIKPKHPRQPEQIALAAAYNMYLHSGFAGAFQEYQDYLQGVPLQKLRQEKAERLRKIQDMVKQRAEQRALALQRAATLPVLNYEERQEQFKKMKWSRKEDSTVDDKVTQALSSERPNIIRTQVRGSGMAFTAPINKTWVRPELQNKQNEMNEALSKSLPATP